MNEGLTNILADVTTFVQTAITWATDTLAEVTVEPILFIFVVAVPLVGLGVGLLKRLMRM